MQNFLTLLCYLLIFLNLILAFSYFVFFNFYYIITERACLRTLSFYFKIYYLNKYVQKISNIKNRTNSTISFFSSFTKNRTSPCILKNQSTPLRPLYFKKLRRTLQLFVATKKTPSREVFLINFVFNPRITIYSTRDSQSSHPHKLARDYSLSNNAASAQYPPPILLANGQSDTYSIPYDLRDKHLTV